MVVDFPVAEQAEEPLDLLVGDGAAQADTVDVAHGHEHGRVVGDDPEMIETASSAENGLVFDALDDPESMIRVNDLVADFKCNGSPCLRKRCVGGRSLPRSSPSIANFRAQHNENGPKP